jgi:alkanesulfonate monooxygenase
MGRLEFCWVLPSTGDDRYLGRPVPERLPTLELLSSTAAAIERAGYDSILVPTGTQNNHFGRTVPYVDSVVAASAAIAFTTRVNLLVAIRTGTLDPTTCARMGATMDVFSGGRFMLNVVSGAAPSAMTNDALDHDARYVRTEEQIVILKGLWTQPQYDFEGSFYRLRNAFVSPRPVQRPHPPVYVAGQSDMARSIAARHADCALIPGTTVDDARKYADDMRARAELEGTQQRLRLGLHFYVFARETHDEARAAAQATLSRVDPDVAGSLGGRPVHDAEADGGDGVPYLWPGLRRLWGGASLALVGGYEEVAAALTEYVAAGFSTFILSGFPMQEEAERVGEHVLPLVRGR